MNRNSIVEMETEYSDGLTFLAICALLDWVSKNDNGEYSPTVAIAKTLVLKIPAEQCRLPFWPKDISGEMIAYNSGFWPILRSLGFEGSNSYEWFPYVHASTLPEAPTTLTELAINIDDLVSAGGFLSTSIIDTLVIRLSVEITTREMLPLLPSTVRNLNWHGFLHHADASRVMEELSELRLPIRKFDARIIDADSLMEIILNVPETLSELGPNLFAVQKERYRLICTNSRFSHQVERLQVGMGDQLAKDFAKATFPRLTSLDLALSQPPNGDRDLFTVDGAVHLANAAWWPKLQDLGMRSVYCDTVLAPLLSACTSDLVSISIAQDDPFLNPHCAKTGITDASLSHLSADVVAGLNSMSIECARLTGTVLERWMSNWPEHACGPRVLKMTSIPWDYYDSLAAFLKSPAVKFVENLDLSWPGLESVRNLNIGEILSKSDYLANLRELNLQGWAFNSRQIISLIDDSKFAGKLLRFDVTFDERDDSDEALEEALQKFFCSPLVTGLRVLALRGLSDADSVCRVLERQTHRLTKLRELKVEAKEFTIISVGRIANATSLKNLWKLSVRGLFRSERDMQLSSVSIRNALSNLGSASILKDLVSLEINNVLGFDEQAVEELLDSTLIEGLQVIPEMDKYKNIWNRSRVLCPLLRGVIQSLIRASSIEHRL